MCGTFYLLSTTSKQPLPNTNYFSSKISNCLEIFCNISQPKVQALSPYLHQTMPESKKKLMLFTQMSKARILLIQRLQHIMYNQLGLIAVKLTYGAIELDLVTMRRRIISINNKWQMNIPIKDKRLCMKSNVYFYFANSIFQNFTCEKNVIALLQAWRSPSFMKKESLIYCVSKPSTVSRGQNE